MRVSEYNGSRSPGSMGGGKGLQARLESVELENQLLWRENHELRQRLRRLAALKVPHSAYTTVETRT